MKERGGLARQVRDELAEAAALQLIGLLLERPRDGWHREVSSLLDESPDPTAPELRAVLETAREGAYLAVLGPGGSVPSREVAYRPMEDPGRILADLQAFYEAFAFHPRSEVPPDHISTELGFAGYLKMKKAYARAQENPEGEAVTAQGLERFMEAHLAGFASALAARLSHSGEPCLEAAARLLATTFPER